MTLANNITQLVDTFDNNTSLIGLYLQAANYDARSLLTTIVGNDASNLISIINDLGIDFGLTPNINLATLGSYQITETYTGGQIAGSQANDLIVGVGGTINHFSGGGGDDIIMNVGSATAAQSYTTFYNHFQAVFSPFNAWFGADFATSLASSFASSYVASLFQNILSGGDGNDFIANMASHGLNSLSGGTGNDTLLNIGNGVSNVLSGDAGNDTLVNIGTGHNVLNGGSGNDTLINYGTGSNQLVGGDGNDVLVNLGSTATIHGGTGHDRLISRAQTTDTLTGGIGRDTFVIRTESDAGVGYNGHHVDIITDYQHGVDTIQIDVANSGVASTYSFNASTGQLFVGQSNSSPGDVVAIIQGAQNVTVAFV